MDTTRQVAAVQEVSSSPSCLFPLLAFYQGLCLVDPLPCWGSLLSPWSEEFGRAGADGVSDTEGLSGDMFSAAFEH